LYSVERCISSFFIFVSDIVLYYYYLCGRWIVRIEM
jgi:hypothetical protein